MFQTGDVHDYLFTILVIYILLFCCIEYQVTNQVTNESKRTTAQLTPDTTITDSQETKDTNSITTIDATNDQVTNEGNGTTLHHTDIPETSVTMHGNSEKTTHSNGIITVSTTFDKNDDKNASYPAKNNHDTVTDRLTTDGKCTP